MHNLGRTRSSQQPNHLLLTPDTFVRTTLPGMKACSAIVHVGPALAPIHPVHRRIRSRRRTGRNIHAAFHFCDGRQREVGGEREIEATRRECGTHISPRDCHIELTASKASRVAVIEKSYQTLDSLKPPGLIISNEDAVSSHPLSDDPGLQVKCLLPDEMSFDFAVNTMVYQPGAALSMVEMHVMEHGLIMLEGGGIYRLGDSWYPVTAGDFIWMGPWCPQWFGAIGKVPAKYLIYKDWNRHPLAGAQR